MQITADHVGDIIRMDLQPEYILIESVTEELVSFCKETGERYSTYDHEIAGSVLHDEDRIQAFHQNIKLGIALNLAEYRAISELLSSNLTHEQRTDAHSVLKTVRNLQKQLAGRILELNIQDAEKQQRSLEALLLEASEHTHCKPLQKPPALQFMAGWER